jgi:hypothetical protein
MKVFVYGKNSDEKGSQLEALTTAILKGMGYAVARNVVKAGGNELDVVATKKEPIGGDINLVCECKAHNSLISMDDWLKFIGKLHLEKRKNQMTHGLMIALSGANGNVLGSYEEIKSDNSITLITNEELFKHIKAFHPMLSEKQVEETIGNYSKKAVVDINIVYYNNVFYWLIGFPNGEYTILKDDLSNIEDDTLELFKSMIESQTESRLFVDIQKENEAIQRRSFIRSLVLSYTLDDVHTLDEIVEWINTVRKDLIVTTAEVEECVEAIRYLRVSDDSTVVVVDESEIDFIEFYRFILQGAVSTRVMATKFYKEHIDRSLLNKIRELQNNIQIPEEQVEECLFLMRHSPMALTYSIYEDKAITRYRSPEGAVFPNIEKAHTEWFMDNVMNGFIADFNNQSLSEYYLDTEKISSIEIHTNLKVYKDGQEPKEIHHYKAECLGHLGKEYNNQAILMV